MAQQGLRLVIGADITQAQAALQEVVAESKIAGRQIDRSFGNATLPVVESLNQVSRAAAAAVSPISTLGDSIETLRAKALAKQQFLITEKDIAKVAILNGEIEQLLGEIARISNAGRAGFDALGNKITVVKSQIDVLAGQIRKGTANFIVLGRVAQITGSNLGGLTGVLNTTRLSMAAITPVAARATSSIAAMGTASVRAFGLLRQAALILPGVGIAGLIGGLSELVFGLFRASQASKETKEALQQLIKPIGDIQAAATAGTGDELAKVNALTNAVLNQSLSYKERNRALDQLKEINKSYFGDLTLEASKLELLKKRVDEYTQALIAAAVVKAFQDEIGKVTVELSKQQRILDKLGATLAKFEDEAKKGTSGIGAQGEVVGRNFAGVQRDVQNASDKFFAQGKVVGALRGQMDDLNSAIQQAVNNSLKFRPLTDPKVLKGPKAVKFEFDALKAIFNDLIAIQKIFSFELSKQAEIRLKIRADFSTANGRAVAGSAFDDFSKQVPAVSAELQKIVDGQMKRNPILISGDKFTIDMSAADAEIRRQLAIINGIIVNTASDAFSGLGEALGSALTGGDLATGLQSFVSTIAGGIQSIGKQLIQLGTVALLAKSALKSLFSNPATMIAAGVALVAVGAALKQTLSGGVKGFAQGGLVFGPTLGLIGEGRGTSRSNPEVIAPLDQLKAMLGDVGTGGRQVVVLRTQVSGNNLALVQARTSRSNKRLGASR